MSLGMTERRRLSNLCNRIEVTCRVIGGLLVDRNRGWSLAGVTCSAEAVRYRIRQLVSEVRGYQLRAARLRLKCGS